MASTNQPSRPKTRKAAGLSDLKVFLEQHPAASQMVDAGKKKKAFDYETLYKEADEVTRHLGLKKVHNPMGAGPAVGDVGMFGGTTLGGGHLSGAVAGRGVTLGEYSMCGIHYYAKADDLIEVGEKIKRARMEDPKDPCLALIFYPLFGIATIKGGQAKKLKMQGWCKCRGADEIFELWTK